MAKVSFTSITPIKSKDDIVVKFGDKDIVIKQYLPIKEKAELVDYIIQSSFDEKSLFSPLRQDIYTTIGMLKWYTNISFTDTMIQNIEKTFDSIIINNVESVLSNIPESEKCSIDNMIKNAIIETKDYLRSFAGQIQYIKQDYDETSFDMKEMSSILQDPNQIGLVKNIMDKMG